MKNRARQIPIEGYIIKENKGPAIVSIVQGKRNKEGKDL